LSDVPLRDFILRILDERDERYRARWDSQEAALKLQSLELERRLEGLNQLRNDVVTDRGQFVTKETVDQLLQASLERYEGMKKEQAQRAETLASADDALAVALAERTEGLAKAINERITPLESFRAKAGFIAGGLVVIGGILGATIVKVLGG
jgi:multidrug resistance efflux pump